MPASQYLPSKFGDTGFPTDMELSLFFKVAWSCSDVLISSLYIKLTLVSDSYQFYRPNNHSPCLQINKIFWKSNFQTSNCELFNNLIYSWTYHWGGLTIYYTHPWSGNYFHSIGRNQATTWLGVLMLISVIHLIQTFTLSRYVHFSFNV